MTEDELDRLAEKVAKKLAPLRAGYIIPLFISVPVPSIGVPYNTPVPGTDMTPTSSMRPYWENWGKRWVSF